MPSKSPAQQRMMRAAANNPKFAKKVGVPSNVAQDFAASDAGQEPDEPPMDDAGIQEGSADDTVGKVKASTADNAGKTVKTVKPKIKGKGQFDLPGKKK